MAGRYRAELFALIRRRALRCRCRAAAALTAEPGRARWGLLRHRRLTRGAIPARGAWPGRVLAVIGGENKQPLPWSQPSSQSWPYCSRGFDALADRGHAEGARHCDHRRPRWLGPAPAWPSSLTNIRSILRMLTGACRRCISGDEYPVPKLSRAIRVPSAEIAFSTVPAENETSRRAPPSPAIQC